LQRAYKWLARYRNDESAALEDKSRAPHTHPNRVEPTVTEALLMVRKAHPHWNARKVLVWLAMAQPTLELPSASTVSAPQYRTNIFTHSPSVNTPLTSAIRR
jgi:putative transposase